MPNASLEDAVAHLRGLIDRLTGPDGCPWDKAQTPESLTEYVVEECHELVDAIRAGQPGHVCEEMGDVAFLLFFLDSLYSKRGGPSLAEAIEATVSKMIRRHPHVFSDTEVNSKSEILQNWEAIKRAEKAAQGEDARKGLFSGLPAGLPPLTKAYRLHSKAARVGFTWPEDEEVERQVEAEWLEFLDACADGDETAIRHEYGDHLFTLVELGRRKGFKAAEVLDEANRRFLKRYEAMEELAASRGKDFAALSLEEKDEIWEEVKAAQKKNDDTTNAPASDSDDFEKKRKPDQQAVRM